MQHEHHMGGRLQSTGWIIDARWYYAPLAFFLGLIAQVDVGELNTLMVLIVSLALMLACNTFFFFYIQKADAENLGGIALDLLNTAQIGIDLIFFFIVMLFTGGGVESIGHSFFFVPIVVSMIVFGFRGAIAVAIASGFLVTLSVLVHAGVLADLGNPLTSFHLTPELSLALLQSGIIFLIYLVTGYFGGYISRLMKARDILLVEQITKGEVHVQRLEELTKEFDQSAKLLVRRDLELTSANEKLIQLDKMKSEIISIVAHQLRTPLSAIKWTLKILLDKDVGDINKGQEDLLSKGFESNERMIRLINDMLAVDRLESGKLKYNFVPVQFEELVQEMIGNLLTLATQKNVRLEFSSAPTALPKIKIDPDKMRDVLQNLIDNAIKYTKDNGVVTVAVVQEDDNLHFSVADNGIGIPEEEKEKIFSRFFRAANAVHTETDGSGLGLFIALSVVKRHSGKMWFESTLNEGTTFHVLLPLNT